MSYLVLRSCVAAGQRRNVGDVVEIDPVEAGNLMAMGRIEEAPAPKKEVKADRSVGLESSDAPAPKKRGRKAKDEG